MDSIRSIDSNDTRQSGPSSQHSSSEVCDLRGWRRTLVGSQRMLSAAITSNGVDKSKVLYFDCQVSCCGKEERVDFEWSHQNLPVRQQTGMWR